MSLTRIVILFIAGFFVKKEVDKHIEKLMSNIAKYEFKTITKER